jgi:PAS domain S-box-containing protein
MMAKDDNEGRSSGEPAGDTMPTGDVDTTGVPSKRHWRQSIISEPGLDERGNVFFAAIEMTRMPMILTDPNLDDCPIVFANKAFLDLTGYEEEEVLGRNCRFLQGAQTDRDTIAELRHAIAKHQSVAVEILNYRRDGSPFWNAVFIGPVYGETGELLYLFASQLDVTRRRNSEQSYRQAQKMEAIGQLTAGLAHDFNNLLQVVNGNLELLGSKLGEDPRATRYVESARSAADRGAKLTRQLLAFARKTRLDSHAVDLSGLIAEFGDMIDSSLGPDIELDLALGNDLPNAVVDAEQFEMALLNIVINARDAMPNGGRVSLSTARRPLDGEAAAVELVPGDYIVVEVRDEGEGMPANVLERAAEPFFTTKGVGKGTGLGLAMASGFALQSHGRLEIESEVGRGTTVRMLFPASHVAGDRCTAHAAADASSREREAEGSGHILVVEDSPGVLELATDILTGAGYRVTTAASGEEAVAAFDRIGAGDGEAIDLLFTDLVMPGINGMVLAETLTGRDPALPVLMTTGYNEELVADGPRQPGADVLGKPYRRAELLDRVRQAINRKPGGARRRPSDFGPAEA